MVKLLLYIKENLHLIWIFIEWLNSGLFKKLYHYKIQTLLTQSIQKQKLENYHVRFLTKSDITSLSKLIENQESAQLVYFKPHNFDDKSLERTFQNPSFFKMGIFFNTQLIGYFFLRCFVNKKCFVGRLVDKDYRGKGIGKVMSEIMYNTAWDSEFRIFATLSPNNKLVMQSHKNNPNMKVLKNLPDNYLLVEFVKPERITKTN